MRIKATLNLGSDFPPLKEGDEGDVPSHIGEKLIRMGAAVQVRVEPVANLESVPVAVESPATGPSVKTMVEPFKSAAAKSTPKVKDK